MKIAFLHLTMGLVERGSEIVVDELASSLSRHHQVMVVQSGPISKKPYLTKRVAPRSLAPDPAPTSIWHKVLFRLHLDKESEATIDFTHTAIPVLTRFQPDIVVAVNGPLQVRLLRGSTPKSKIVTFGHAGIGYHDRDTLRCSPDLFVALTQTAKDWANGLAQGKTKVVFIPNPISPKNAKKIDLGLTAPVVMCVGALSAYKNITSVVRAVGSSGMSLLLIGDGEGRGIVQSELSQFSGEFRHLMHVDPAQMSSYYASADLFCFVPDTQEAFGRVYLEAMVAGLPIVASDDRVRRDLVGPRGIYVDPHDESAITDGIIRASQLGHIDYTEQLKPYLLNQVTKQIEAEFHDLLK